MLVYTLFFFFVGISTCEELSAIMDSVVIYLLTDKGEDSFSSFYFIFYYLCDGFFECKSYKIEFLL